MGVHSIFPRSVAVGQCFSHLKVYENPLEDLFQPQSFWFNGSGVRPETLHCEQVSTDAAACLETTFLEPLPYTIPLTLARHLWNVGTEWRLYSGSTTNLPPPPPENNSKDRTDSMTGTVMNILNPFQGRILGLRFRNLPGIHGWASSWTHIFLITELLLEI